jgi:hypothetical protein
MMTHEAPPAYDVFVELGRLQLLATGAFCRWPRNTWRSQFPTPHLFLGLPVLVALLWIVTHALTN